MSHVLRGAALGVALFACSTPTKPVLSHFRPSQITFVFDTGIQPDLTLVIQPLDWNGKMCPASGVQLENHPTTYPDFVVGDELVGTGHCTGDIEIAYCRVNDGTSASDVPVCSLAARETPADHLRFATLAKGVGDTRTHWMLGHTPRFLRVQVFYCTDNTTFNLDQFTNFLPTECVPD